MTRTNQGWMCALAVVAGGPAAIMAGAPSNTVFTYQGRLQRGGVPINDTCNLTFRLFDAAVDGGQVGFDVAAPGRGVVNGLIAVDLDFGPGRFDGAARWLEVAVACTGDATPVTLTPRQTLTAAPQAINADRLDGLDSSAFLQNVPNPLALTGSSAIAVIHGGNSSAETGAAGVYGESAGTTGRGVYGKSTAVSGTNYGVFGEGFSASGAGVYGFSVPGDGVSGRSDAAGKAAVFAWMTNSAGWAVLGRHTSLAGITPAIQGETASGITGAKGVYGLATNAANGTFGVYGESAGSSGQGVFGKATSATGITYGVQGQTNSPTNGAAGVIGLANAPSGQTFGVYGRTESNTGYSVYGQHSGSGRAVFGSSSAGAGVYATTSTGTFALYGERTANGNRGWIGGSGEGVWGESSNGAGVVGKTTNGATAVFGERIANGNRGWLGAPTEGVHGEASQGNGVAGVSTDPNGYGGSFRNDGGGAALFADGLARVRTLEIINGGDLAEPFEVTVPQDIIRTASGSDRSDRRGEATKIEVGMVVVIDPGHPGALRPSTTPYDRKVAGVISGANGLSPGMMMKAKPKESADGDYPVALTGRVWCWCDATADGGAGPVEPGDLLTTSRTLGHAMKALPGADAPGAVIGKAMTALPQGRGLVLVLVNLQ